MKRGIIAILLVSIASFLCLPGVALAAGVSVAPRPDTSLANSIGAGASVGAISGRDADFWGWTVDYTRLLSPRWSTTVSWAFDRETERRDGQQNSVVDTHTLIWVANYALNDRWSVSSGLAKSLLDDDNPAGSLKWVDGDWSTGIAFATAISARINWSFALEYNINKSEPSVSTDIGIRWDF